LTEHPITLTRDNFTVSGQRNYVATVSGPRGQHRRRLLRALLAGLPEGRRRRIQHRQSAVDGARRRRSNRDREEVNLTPFFQYILMNPGDRLVRAQLRGNRPRVPVPVELTLAVNELTRPSTWSGRSPTRPSSTTTRAFGSSPGTSSRAERCPRGSRVLLEPGEQRPGGDRQTEQWPIPISALSPFGRMYGSLFSVRYSNSNNDGKLIVVESQTRAFYEGQLNGAQRRGGRAPPTRRTTT
jgi:hypothetical protein